MGTESRLIINDSPRARNIPTSVTRNEGISRKCMRLPMVKPSSAPQRRQIKITIRGGISVRASRLALKTPVNATRDPTERSIPPEIITKVMPTAIMPTKALSIKRFTKTRREKNPL